MIRFMPFRENVRMARTAAGLSINAAAQRVGMKAGQWKDIEDGRNANPGISTALRLSTAVGIPISKLLDEKPLYVEQTFQMADEEFVAIPLVAVNVAAGPQATIEVPEGSAHFAFRTRYLKRVIGASRPGRLVTVFLARNKSLGSSMLPTIQPGSMLLIDRRVEPERIENGGIYLVEYPGCAEDHGLAIKRVNLDAKRGLLILYSDNAAYQPISIWLSEDTEPIDVIRGRVIMWSTTDPELEKKTGYVPKR